MVEIIQLDNEEEMNNIPTHIENINNRLKENKVIICAVYMPGCRHCEVLKPIWDETMSQFKQQPLDGMITSMNMDIPQQLNYKQEPIRGFPHIMALKGGKMIQYDKMTRTEKDLMKFVNEHIGGKQVGGMKRGRRMRNRSGNKKTNKSNKSKKAGKKSKKTGKKSKKTGKKTKKSKNTRRI